MSDAGLDFLVQALADPSDGRTPAASPFTTGTIISIGPVVLRLGADTTGASDIIDPLVATTYVPPPVAGDTVLCAQMPNTLVVICPVGRSADYLAAFVTFYGDTSGIAYIGDDVPPYDAPVSTPWLDLSGDLGAKVQTPGTATEYDTADPYRRMAARDEVAGNATSPSVYWGGQTPPATEPVGSLWADDGRTNVPYPATRGYWIVIGQGGETWFGGDQPAADRPRGATWLDFGTAG